ncbi:DUF4126 family protein [Mucilaginibacter sabulilitoris]|uniref:DUF4126 family protein n=1 Tax=Mucilaginibacter sabulilitoris TaxID=1173583 RepID=A0ABZ0TGJ2_9SPHI|nr:DUF4126 family protein [Mucilaginibacter sabulilitoris]WPU91921.1 DUF4126 family protein [Mucilaginibacter sabulilitoris]
MLVKISKPFWQVLSLGTLAGMRSTSAPVITSHILSHHQSKNLEHSPLKFMQSKTVAATLKVLALGEIVGDKLPSAPNRTKPAAIGARVLSGALAGAVIYKATGNNLIVGALLGGTAAFASTFGTFHLRKSVVKSSHIVDPIIGAIEDALVIGGSVGLARLA